MPSTGALSCHEIAEPALAHRLLCETPVLTSPPGTFHGLRMPDPRLNPEQQARDVIDAMLQDAGWVVQDYAHPDFAAGPGVAIREFPTPRGPMDYLLVADGKVVGSLEAKRAGLTLLQVEAQADRYAEGFQELVASKPIPRYFDELPFHYISTGQETLFTSRRDPIRRPREVFHFHKPETLAEWAQQEQTYRAKLRLMPPANTDGLRDVQKAGLGNLETSLADDRPKALAAITMGGGKTRLAVAETYRLLRFAGAQRVLFLVDRVSLGGQARTEFLSYVSPDDGRRFGDLFGVQVMRSNRVDPAANVVICTIQRLYSMLRGEEHDYDPELDDISTFELPDDGPPIEVAYNRSIPVEFVDHIWIDEAHRSIYGRWGQVLDYFDAFQVGLTATPTPTTLAYFDDNVIAEYSQEQSVYDGVNVDQQLYRIRTEVGERGATIQAGEWIKVRDKHTRAVERRQLADQFVYDPVKLDRAVVNPSQIRAVVRTFKERVTTEIFPGRDEVPKTIFFAKHDQHAEDILKIVREEFARGSEFAKKITYKAEGTVEENINQFRNDPQLRITVTVEQIGTGTDIKAVECLVFMRMVGSRVLMNQMRGRAVRTMNPDDFWQVTPGAQEKGQTKDYSVLIDCVGLTDEETVLIDSSPMDRARSVPLQSLLRDIGMGMADENTLRSVAVRLVRLDKKLNEGEREEFEAIAGVRLISIVERLSDAADPEVHEQRAQDEEQDEQVSDDAIKAARSALIEEAVQELRRSEVRKKIEELQLAAVEQFIHIGGHDELVSAGFVSSPVEAESVVSSWRQFIEEHHDEYLALKAFYAQPYRRRPGLKEIKQLAAAISRPPHNLTPERVWSAYEQLEKDRVRGHGGKLHADLVQLIRFTLEQDDELVPHEDVIHLRFDVWLREQEADGRKFSDEQLRWLTMVRDYIAASMTFDPAEDFDFPPFAEEGGATAAYELFGPDLRPVIDELNEALVVA